MRTIDDIIKSVQSYNPSVDDTMIKQAYSFAEKAHAPQKRLTGEPYITHPLEIAYILAGLQMDTPTIIAGLLHDVIEDTKYTYEDIQENFGAEVAELVEGVTKIARLEYTNKEEQQIETFRKMFVAMAKDIRVIIIKLADRLHNMRTLEAMQPDKQKLKSHEVLDIYAPITHRLGIFQMKMEFEDLALRFLEPEAYVELTKSVAQKRSEREEIIQNLINILKKKLESEGIECEITGRPKNFYSIYKKIKSGRNFEEIYDLTAIRVLVNTVNDCYTVLMWVHELWKPVPRRFKDYIAMPKPNMYQSLHTTVIGPGGSPFEIQIRTKEMHRTAEYGIAAHWKYKEGTKGNDDLADRLRWLLELQEIEQDAEDASEFIDAVKTGLYSDEVYVFTPKGKVIELPKNSTPIDFAYRIHSDIGNKCVGARVNNKMVPLTYKLNMGDRVEIITNPNSKGPSRDWLNIVASASARSKIRGFFRKADREENILKGKDSLEKEIKNHHFLFSQIIRKEYADYVFKRFNVASWDDLYSTIGYGGVKANYVIQRIKDNFKNDFPADERKPNLVNAPSGKKDRIVHIQGHEDMAVKFAKCCMPVPGDNIIGYITRGKGVTIHRADCINITSSDETERLISAGWVEESSIKEKFSAELYIKATDRTRLLSDIVATISNEGINISGNSLKTLKDGSIHISIHIVVTSAKQVDNIISKLQSIPNVITAFRV